MHTSRKTNVPFKGRNWTNSSIQRLAKRMYFCSLCFFFFPASQPPFELWCCWGNWGRLFILSCLPVHCRAESMWVVENKGKRCYLITTWSERNGKLGRLLWAPAVHCCPTTCFPSSSHRRFVLLLYVFFISPSCDYSWKADLAGGFTQCYFANDSWLKEMLLCEKAFM